MPFAPNNNQYGGSAGSGAGAYILERDKPKDAVDAFLQTYETAKRWKAYDDEKKQEKVKYLDQKLADLDFKTDGVLPSSKVIDYLQQGKKEMQSERTRFYQEGINPDDPTFYEAYNQSNAKKKNYEVAVDGLKGANTMVTALINDANTRPDDYNQDEVSDFIHRVYNAPVVATQPGEKTITDLLAEIPKPKSKSWDEVFSASIKDVKESTEPSIEGGAVYEYKGKGGVTEPERQDLIRKLFVTNPDLQDKTMSLWSDLHEQAVNGDEGAAQKVLAVQDMAKKMNASPEEAYAVMLGMPKLHTEKLFKQFTPTEKAKQSAIWKNWGFGQREEEQLMADNWQLLQMLTGKGGFAYGEDGSYSYTYAPDMEIGKFADETGKTTVNSLLDYQWDENPQTGKPIFRYRTTKSGDQWIETDNQKEIANIVFNNARYGMKAGAGASQFYDWARELGIWDEKTKNIDLEKASKLFADEEALGESELLAGQQSILKTKLTTGGMVTSQNLAKGVRTDNLANPTGTDIAESIDNKEMPLTVKQRKLYNEFVAKNKRMPTNQEVLRIIEGKAPTSTQPSTTTQSANQPITGKPYESGAKGDRNYDNYINVLNSQYASMGKSNPEAFKNSWQYRPGELDKYYDTHQDETREKGALLNNAGYEAIDAFENSKGTAQGTSMQKGAGYSRTQEAEIKSYVEKNIGLDAWNNMPPKLQMQVYSLAFNSVKDARIIRGLAQAIAPDKIKTDADRQKLSEADAKKIIRDVFAPSTAPKKDWSKYKR